MQFKRFVHNIIGLHDFGGKNYIAIFCFSAIYVSPDDLKLYLEIMNHSRIIGVHLHCIDNNKS